jgi:hypothetical protein
VLLGGHGVAPGLVPGVPGVALPDPEVLEVPDVPGEFTQGVLGELGFGDPGVVLGEAEGLVVLGLVAFGIVSGVPVVDGEVLGDVVFGVDPGTGVVVAPGVVLGVEVVPGVVLGVDVVPGVVFGVEVVPGVCAPGVVVCGIVL